jgi:methyltransferase FkbM-like protein
VRTVPIIFLCFFCWSHWNTHVGHTFIDVLKIDIEGAEFDTLTSFLAANRPRDPFAATKLPVGQLQLELHAWDDYANFAFFHDWWTALERAGLRPFWTEPNLVYVNYAKGAKPQLAEVRGQLMNSRWRMLSEVCDSTRL